MKDEKLVFPMVDSRVVLTAGRMAVMKAAAMVLMKAAKKAVNK
jgi:hypothetical protein